MLRVSIFEYDEEEHMRQEREESRQEEMCIRDRVRTEHFRVCKSFTGTQDPYRAGMAGAWKYCGNDGRRRE